MLVGIVVPQSLFLHRSVSVFLSITRKHETKHPLSTLLSSPIDRLLPATSTRNLLDPSKLARPPLLDILVAELVQPVKLPPDEPHDMSELSG